MFAGRLCLTCLSTRRKSAEQCNLMKTRYLKSIQALRGLSAIFIYYGDLPWMLWLVMGLCHWGESLTCIFSWLMVLSGACWCVCMLCCVVCFCLDAMCVRVAGSHRHARKGLEHSESLGSEDVWSVLGLGYCNSYKHGLVSIPTMERVRAWGKKKKEGKRRERVQKMTALKCYPQL